MEVTALKGSSGDVQHCADRIIAERGVRYGRVAMIPTSAKTKRRPNAHLTSETPVVACPFRVSRVGLMLRRSLPVFPDKRTSHIETSTSEKCQFRKSNTNKLHRATMC
jgi:hypothetical protein